MNPKRLSSLSTIVSLLILSQIFSSCSTSQPFYFAKGTGAFKDAYATKSAQLNNLTAQATKNSSGMDVISLQPTPGIPAEIKNNSDPEVQKIVVQKPSRKELKKLKARLEAVLDTTKKRERVTIKTNEKKVDELRNEVQGLKNSVRTEKDGDKVVVSFDKPQTSLSKEAKILIVVGAVLLLVGLLSLPIIGPVLGVILGIAVVAAALALILGVIEIN